MIQRLNAYQAVLDALPTVAFIKCAKHQFVYANRQACLFFGVSLDSLIGKTDHDLFPAKLAHSFLTTDIQVLSSGKMVEFEEQVGVDGEQRFFVTRKSLLAVEQERLILATCTDITALRESEARIRHLAYHDHLTGLPNRMMLFERLTNELTQRNGATSVAPLALLLLDLDGFKSVNDTYGHPAGDELLREFGKRLERTLANGDLVARMGGDEFAVLVQSASDPHTLHEICLRILAVAKEPFNVADVPSFVSTSIGAMPITDDISAAEVVRKADIALYRAKGEGKGRFSFFNPELDSG
jgi:diguanylate cyclase (GGDEF)-like protein/PAS domain S-box-containing protein